MEEALLLLPFACVCRLLQMLPPLLERGDQTELVCKVAMFLLRIHHPTIVSNQLLMPNLKQLQKLAMVKAQELRVGFC